MSIKHILVHLDHSRRGLARLDFAFGLARRQQAFLTVCFAVVSGGWQQEEQARLKESFMEQISSSELPAQWLCLDEAWSNKELAIQFCRMAQCADLVIVGQQDPKNDTGVPQNFPETLVLHTGRPVLILPYTGHFDHRCERVMVAWSGGRESVRALHDSLPLLKQARQVNLLSLLLADGKNAELERSLTMICEHLRHHGIKAHPEQQVRIDISKGDMLLNRCAEEGIGLLVVGGYSQDRLGEVAKSLLKQMTTPVLMSH